MQTQKEAARQYNKFTLNFNDPKLEEHYQANEVQTSKYPTFQIISWLFFIHLVIILINRIIIEKPMKDLIYTIGLLFYVLVSMGMARKFQWMSQTFLIILSLLIFFYHIGINDGDTLFIFFLLGQNILCLYGVIMFIIDFKYGFIITVGFTIMRLVYNQLVAGLKVEGYSFTIMSTITLLIGIYWKHRNSRIQYLLTLKDNQWVHLLPKLVDNEFFIFSLNSEQLKFELKMSNQGIGDNPNFIKFLRESYMGSITLEQYIFRRAQASENGNWDHYAKLKVKNNGVQVQIKYFEYNTMELTFMVAIESKEIHQLKLKYQNINKHQLNHFSQFIHKLSVKLFEYSRITKTISTFTKLQLVLIDYQTRLQINFGNLKLTQFSINLIVMRCLKLFPEKNITLEHYEEFNILSIKCLLTLLLINLMECAKSLTIIIKTHGINNVELLCQGKFNRQQLRQNDVFSYALKKLTIIYESRLDGYRLIFPKQIDLSYLPELI